MLGIVYWFDCTSPRQVAESFHENLIDMICDPVAEHIGTPMTMDDIKEAP